MEKMSKLFMTFVDKTYVCTLEELYEAIYE